MALRRNPNQKWDLLKHTAAQARLPFERDAWLNVAFYLNQQYVHWHAQSDSLRAIPRAPGTENVPRPVVNKIMHYVRQMRTSVTKDQQFPDVMPPTSDIQDMMDAAVARAYCEHVADPTAANFQRSNSRASLWAILCGNGYLKWTWNDTEKAHEITPCSFFDLYLDPYATDFTRNRYVIHSKFMDVEQVYEAWGKEVDPGKVETADVAKTELLRGMGSAPVMSGVTVNELWMKPCRKYPNGLYTVWTGKDTLIEPGDHPYKHQRLPFTQIGCIERPDSQYYMSPVTYLRPAQMELNKYHAQKIYNREKIANYKWWIPSELELEEDPNDKFGQILKGSAGMGGLRPEILAPPALPDNGDGAMIEEQMMHIVGKHEVSQAQVPGRVEAAKAIELLKDSDEGQEEMMRETIDTSICEGFFQVLELARQYETEEKMVLTFSREGVPQVRKFRKGTLKPGYRVRTARTTGLSRSRSARFDQVQRMWDAQMITDQEVAARILDMPSPTFINHKAHDITLAQNENLDLAEDTAITPNSYDEHALHIREHNTYRKTLEYQGLDEETKKKFDVHVQMHEQMLDAALVKAAERAQLAAASQPGAPRPAGDSATPPPDEGTVA